MTNDVQRKFKQLRDMWLEETKDYRRIAYVIANPSYEDIIEMGIDAFPLIIEELKKELQEGKQINMWFFALHKITKLNPIPPEEWADQRLMAQRWVEWAEENKEFYPVPIKGSEMAEAV